MSFDQYEAIFYNLCEEKYGPSEDLLHNYHADAFAEIQNFVKLWEIKTLDKRWICDNPPLLLRNTVDLLGRASSIYALFNQGFDFSSPITIIKSKERYIVSPGHQKYALNRICKEIKISAVIIDFDKSDTIFDGANPSHDYDLFFKKGFFGDPVYWMYLQKQQSVSDEYDLVSSKFSGTDEKQDFWSFKVDFLSKIDKFKHSLVFYFAGKRVANLQNGKPDLNIELDSLEGLAQFVLKYFCDYNDFNIDLQYRIMA